MCYAAGSPFWDLFVSASNLCVAGPAWRTAGPVLRTFRLLELRKKNRTLNFDGSRKVMIAKLPGELIELVKLQVCREALYSDEVNLVDDYHIEEKDSSCNYEGCDGHPGDRLDELNGDMSLCHFQSCDSCADNFFENGGLPELVHIAEKVRLLSRMPSTIPAHLLLLRLQDIKSLSHTFGLALRDTTVISTADFPDIDLNALCPITLCTSATQSLATVEAGIAHDYHSAPDAYLISSPTFFNLHVTSYFRTFFRLFPLMTGIPTSQKPSQGTRRCTTGA
ncbi:hypothetical protein JCM11641_003049 [Rhodosporidiobolus odoratus]